MVPLILGNYLLFLNEGRYSGRGDALRPGGQLYVRNVGTCALAAQPKNKAKTIYNPNIL